MLEGLRCKFNSHKELKERLLQTGEKPIVEHYAGDLYWSNGGDGSGKNRMGVLLMKLRDEFRKEA